MDEALSRNAPGLLDAAGLAAEVARFDLAAAVVAADLDEVVARVAREVSESAAAIFCAHRALLADPGFAVKVRDYILRQHLDAPSALELVLSEYTTLFSRIPDEYLRERLSDFRDVIGRLIAQLTVDASRELISMTEPVVLVAPEILPSQTVMFGKLPVVGILTEMGGGAGHAGILARSLGIPTVSGIAGLLQDVHTGDMLVVDAREGTVLVNPGPETEAIFRRIQRDYDSLRHQVVDNRELEAVTTDGVPVHLLANVNSVLDAATAVGVGAVGIGLYRSEYLFLTHPAVPDEEEQYRAYRAIVEASPASVVTIRTLDLGGDKQVRYLGNPRHEANPMLGWRSVRLLEEYPDFFRTQMRAILRSAVHGQVRLLVPMITTIEEVTRVREMFEQTCEDLERQGIPHGEDVPFGIMIEVPAAAFCIDQLLDYADFISIGSNDLIQYLMAADRDNPRVAQLCEPCHPAVFRILKMILDACNARDVPITLCGEMAGRPRCLLPLLGLGLRQFSMSPGFLPTLKRMVRSVPMSAAADVAQTVMQMRSYREVRDYLNGMVDKYAPQVARLDIR